MQSMSGQSFMWIAFGVAALVVALALAAVLVRLRGTLGAVEALLDTTNEEMKETLPEVRQTIELSGSEPVQRAREAASKARTMVTDPEHPVGKAIQDGVAAARRKREELEATAARRMQRASTNLEE